jgi:hypothetical protein
LVRGVALAHAATPDAPARSEKFSLIKENEKLAEEGAFKRAVEGPV